jgi:hypothetical protein
MFGIDNIAVREIESNLQRHAEPRLGTADAESRLPNAGEAPQALRTLPVRANAIEAAAVDTRQPAGSAPSRRRSIRDLARNIVPPASEATSVSANRLQASDMDSTIPASPNSQTGRQAAAEDTGSPPPRYTLDEIRRMNS